MTKVSKLVSSDDRIAAFKIEYKIPQDVEIKPCIDGEVAENRGFGKVVIPLIPFVEGGVRIPLRNLLVRFLRHFKLCLDQCAPNVFGIVSCVNILNERLGLKLTEQDSNYMYNCKTFSKKKKNYKTLRKGDSSRSNWYLKV